MPPGRNVNDMDPRSPSKLTRVHGEVRALHEDGGFELCSTVFLASRDYVSRERDDDGHRVYLFDRLFKFLNRVCINDWQI